MEQELWVVDGILELNIVLRGDKQIQSKVRGQRLQSSLREGFSRDIVTND